MSKKLLLISCFLSSFLICSQEEISFEYDTAGNQVLREVICINCGTTATAFTLYNATTDQPIGLLTNGQQIPLSQVANIPLNFVVATNPYPVGSVKMTISGDFTHTQKENYEPYALFGNSGSNYYGNILGLGTYTLTATPYSEKDYGGEQGTPLSLTFHIVENAVTGLTLYNANTDQPMMLLTEGQQISLSEVQNIPLNIVADTDPYPVGSVKMVLSGGYSHTQKENYEPYALFGNSGSNYSGRILGIGDYTVTITTYSALNWGGTVGIPYIVNFSIVDNPSSARIAGTGTEGGKTPEASLQNKTAVLKAPVFYPNPVKETLHIGWFNTPDKSVTKIIVLNVTGQVVEQQNITAVDQSAQLHFAALSKGIYTVILEHTHGERTVQKIIKK